MKNVVALRVVSRALLLATLCCALPGWTAEKRAPQLDVATLPVSQLRPGMRGVAYTVFEGTKVEPMELEVLGVLKDANGPKSDIILVRLMGKKPEYTGVVAGMSGSPVYVDGKLVGALAFRVGQFAKDPIAGVTPIADMLEIDALDQTLPESRARPEPARTEVSRTSGPGAPGEVQSFSQYLQPIETPLVFSGFSEEAVRLFAPRFKEMGIVPVTGIGAAASDQAQPEPLVPGSAVSAVLVRGDLNVAGTCTVTYVDPQRLLACGHPLLQFGHIEMPMTKAYVVTTLASPANAFKIVNTTEPVGAFVQDRHSGILGEFGKSPKMIPVTLRVQGGARTKEFHYEVLNNAKMTPVAIMATVFTSLQGLNESGEDATYRMSGKIRVEGYPDVTVQNMFAPMDAAQPTAFAAALSVGERFSRIFDNPYATPAIEGVTMDFEVLKERRWARLESVRTDVTEARPGDEITLEASLRPYRGERIVKQIAVKIPTSTPKGTLRILVSDGDTLDRGRRSPVPSRKLDLGSTIALLNKEHTNDQLYVSLLEANPQAMVEDKVMPTLPLSVMNVMEGMRGTQDMVVVGESAVNEYATPMDYVVTGAQMLTVSIK
ncbi:MAG TPA: SpoIVB peptidase S55 domain-containing protein [Terriglobales bacterium]|nr:SpoIVB peptidase S55 domain-containing protein [Terriglobales bacterium]